MTVLGLLDPEDRGTMILQNIWKYSSKLEVSQPRGLQSSVTMLQEWKTSKITLLTCTYNDKKFL